jgi:AbrB family looped-hinge helix DNA binding protein
MPVTRIGPKHQITIPKEVFEHLHLAIGDYLDVRATEDGILLVPQKLIPKEQEWFYTPEWQEKEREADEAIRHGEVSGPFTTVEELMEHLAGEAKGRKTPQKKKRA